MASLIDSIKGLFAPVEVYAAEEHITYNAGEGNGAEDSQEGEEWTIEHITWKLDAEKSSLPEFDSSEESAGAVYIYTPTIPETDEKWQSLYSVRRSNFCQRSMSWLIVWIMVLYYTVAILWLAEPAEQKEITGII